MQKPNINQHHSGWWQPSRGKPDTGEPALHKAILEVNRPLFIINLNGKMACAQHGTITIGDKKPIGPDTLPLMGYVPALHPRDLGDREFKEAHKLRYAYVAGAMANGITSVEMVEAAGRNGMIGFYGAAGLLPAEIESAIVRLQDSMASMPFGFNLIHSPTDPALEQATVDLYLRKGIQLVSASAYLDLTLPLVFYRVNGIYRNARGKLFAPIRSSQKCHGSRSHASFSLRHRRNI